MIGEVLAGWVWECEGAFVMGFCYVMGFEKEGLGGGDGLEGRVPGDTLTYSRDRESWRSRWKYSTRDRGGGCLRQDVLEPKDGVWCFNAFVRSLDSSIVSGLCVLDGLCTTIPERGARSWDAIS